MLPCVRDRGVREVVSEPPRRSAGAGVKRDNVGSKDSALDKPNRCLPGRFAFCPRWQVAFASERKDHRYYELVEDTPRPEFDYRYFVIKDAVGQGCAVQPFSPDQDLLVGASSRYGVLVDAIRRPVIAMSGSADHAGRMVDIGCVYRKPYLS